MNRLNSLIVLASMLVFCGCRNHRLKQLEQHLGFELADEKLVANQEQRSEINNKGTFINVYNLNPGEEIRISHNQHFSVINSSHDIKNVFLQKYLKTDREYLHFQKRLSNSVVDIVADPEEHLIIYGVADIDQANDINMNNLIAMISGKPTGLLRIRLLAILMVFLQSAAATGQEHIHRFYYELNGRERVPEHAQIKIVENDKTLDQTEVIRKFMLAEPSEPFNIIVNVDAETFEAGPFNADVLNRSAKFSFFKVTDLGFLTTTNNLMYRKAATDYLSSSRRGEISKVLILVIEVTPQRINGKKFEKGIYGRYKFFYSK